MYKDTITLFNRYSSSLGVLWYPTVLQGVNLNTDKANITSKYGTDTTATATVHIRYDVFDGNKYVENKAYLPPKAWEQQVNDMLSETITFTPGSNFDFFVVGSMFADAEEPIKDSSYMPGGFYDYMRKRLDGVYAIEAVSGPFSLIPHFEILGR